MAEEIRISGQMNTVVRPDERGIPQKVEIPSKILVVAVGGEIVSATRRRALGIDTHPSTITQTNQERGASGYRSRWSNAHSTPASGTRLLG